jgi:hypothetical protein
MNRKALIAVAFVELSLVHSHSTAGEVPVQQCPPELLIQQYVSSPVGDGWKAGNTETLHPLSHISVAHMESLITQTGSDIPTEKRLSNGDVIVYYDYISNTQGRPHYSWAVCEYAKSYVKLVQELPANVARCEIRYPNNRGASNQAIYKCFDTSREIQ